MKLHKTLTVRFKHNREIILKNVKAQKRKLFLIVSVEINILKYAYA